MAEAKVVSRKMHEEQVAGLEATIEKLRDDLSAACQGQEPTQSDWMAINKRLADENAELRKQIEDRDYKIEQTDYMLKQRKVTIDRLRARLLDNGLSDE